MTVPDPEPSPESEDGEVDPFAELGVQATASAGSVSDGLDAFMEDDEEGEEAAESAPVEVESPDGEDDDEDMFATLGVSGPAVSLASSGEEDILAAFMDDDDDEPQEPEVEEESEVEEDFLDADPPIRGQNFCLMSFWIISAMMMSLLLLSGLRLGWMFQR